MGCTLKIAEKKISESEIQQKSFHKDFFNFDLHNPEMFDFLINTSKINTESIVDSVSALTKTFVNKQREEEGQNKIDSLLIGQRIVDILVFIYNLNIDYLRASIKNKKITLHGIADSTKTVDAALTRVEAELPGFEIESAITVGHNYGHT